MGKKRMSLILAAITFLAAAPYRAAHAVDYPYKTAEPQQTGWPLTDDERAYVLKPEYVRRPGSELKKSLFTADNIHLSQDGGYGLYAEKLQPLVDKQLGGK